jgi:hypothetical protein
MGSMFYIGLDVHKSLDVHKTMISYCVKDGSGTMPISSDCAERRHSENTIFEPHAALREKDEGFMVPWVNSGISNEDQIRLNRPALRRSNR